MGGVEIRGEYVNNVLSIIELKMSNSSVAEHVLIIGRESGHTL